MSKTNILELCTPQLVQKPGDAVSLLKDARFVCIHLMLDMLCNNNNNNNIVIYLIIQEINACVN